MKIKKTIRILFIIFLFFFFFVVVFLFVSYKTMPPPPVNDIRMCRYNLNEADRLDAKIFSPDLFHDAESLYMKAFDEWKYQNTKFFLFRKYDLIKELSFHSSNKAEQAKYIAIREKKNIRFYIDNQFDTLYTLRNDSLYYLFSKLPVFRKTVKKNYTTGFLLASEAEKSYLRKDYKTSVIKLEEAKKLIFSSINQIKKYLDNYFENYPLWKDWIDSTIAYSRNNKEYALIINKIIHKCYVFKNGKIKFIFDVDLGKNWIGDKHRRGDKATPEGIYYIKKKLKKGTSKYYKALLLDYPNPDDIKRFKFEKKKGILPKNAHIGGLIEIHGYGGKGVDWTEGCVALRNEDIDIIFDLVKKGTPITIVGSFINLKELMK